MPKTTEARGKSIWAEITVGDRVYLDYRLGFRRAAWLVLKIDDDGFLQVRSEHGDVAMIRGDAVTGWFIGKEREERAPMPSGALTDGPPLKRKRTRDRGERSVDV